MEAMVGIFFDVIYKLRVQEISKDKSLGFAY